MHLYFYSKQPNFFFMRLFEWRAFQSQISKNKWRENNVFMLKIVNDKECSYDLNYLCRFPYQPHFHKMRIKIHQNSNSYVNPCSVSLWHWSLFPFHTQKIYIFNNLWMDMVFEEKTISKLNFEQYFTKNKKHCCLCMFSVDKFFTLYAIFSTIYKFQVLSTKERIKEKKQEKRKWVQIESALLRLQFILFYFILIK